METTTSLCVISVQPQESVAHTARFEIECVFSVRHHTNVGASMVVRNTPVNTTGQSAGLPGLTVDAWFPMKQFSKQLSTAFILFIVGFMESISISKALARKNKYEIGVQQEIIAMGISNLFGAMFSSYATTGSFSRSAVSADIGAKRQLQGTITGAVYLCAVAALLGYYCVLSLEDFWFASAHWPALILFSFCVSCRNNKLGSRSLLLRFC